MYKLKLILKYLLKRRIAWVSLVAVTLCTAMVLVVISVMGGWLEMFKDINHKLGGDVVIYRSSLTGFSHYQDILDQVRKMPIVKAAVPVIRTVGLINIVGKYQDEVQVVAYGDLDQVGKVNSFQNGLYRQHIQAVAAVNADATLTSAQKKDKIAEINASMPSFDKPFRADFYRMLMFGSKVDVSNWPGMILGTSMVIHKNAEGGDNRATTDLLACWVQLTIMDLGGGSTVAQAQGVSKKYWLVDDCQTNFYPEDSRTVYVPFDKLQRDLGMSERTYTETINDQSVERTQSACTSEIQIALNPGVDVYEATAQINAKVGAMVKTLQAQDVQNRAPDQLSDMHVESWDQRQGKFLGAVEHEKVLLTFLFGIISIVAIFLVFCIFFMIVVEKTRDIGIIKSVGATSEGVAQIFLGYGLLIGFAGAGMGLMVGYLIIHNINYLHTQLGNLMHVKIWDPETYMFDSIPNTMNPHDVLVIVTIAILSALLGAVIPAIRAGRMHPVDSLRFE